MEQDLVEAIIALPTDMFYNTGIATYIWILSNHKEKERQGKVQLINANSDEFCDKMRKSLGSKRKYLTEKHIAEIVKLYGSFKKTKISKIFKTTEFGYRRITVERPLRLSFHPHDKLKLSSLGEDATFSKLSKKEADAILKVLESMKPKYDDREKFLSDLSSKIKLTPSQEKLIVKYIGEQDETAKVCKNSKGEIEPDSDLRDSENVPLGEKIETYFAREVFTSCSGCLD